jgi:hypothetical protein
MLTTGSLCARIAAQMPQATTPDIVPVGISADAASLDGCQVVARIEGQVILACEVLWKVNHMLEKEGDRIPPEQLERVRQDLIQKFVADMIDRKVIYTEFRRAIPPEKIPEIDEQLLKPFEEEELPKLMTELGVESRQDLEKELVRLGSTLGDVRRAFNEKAIIQNWVHSKVKINETVSPDEMLAYYRSHQAEYDYPSQARWEELVVRKGRFAQPGQAFAELSYMGNEVWQRAAALPGGVHGPAFVEVAKARSDGLNAKEGGQYDWTPKGALKNTAIDMALFSLQVGQMSAILESESSFHIVRVLERKEAGRRSFADVQGDIRDKLKEERFQKAVVTYLETLRRNARVWTEQTGDVSAEAFLAQTQPKTQAR